MRARCGGRVSCFRTHGVMHNIRKDMLTETIDPQLRTWTAQAADPGEDRIMLAIQYAVAIVAALAAVLLSLVN
jgi:hypothetical protein